VAPHVAAADSGVEIGIDIGEFLLQLDDMGVETPLDFSVGGLLPTQALGGDHFHNLASARGDFAEAWVCSSGCGRNSGRMRSANKALTAASRLSVLASRPQARAKSRICRD